MTCRLMLLVSLGLSGLSPASAWAGKMVRITIDGGERTGTVRTSDASHGWFLERDGRLSTIRLGDVTDYEVLGNFKPYSTIELRDQLRREFDGYTVGTTAHYLVVSAKGVDGRYATLFEELYRQFVVTFSARGFKMRDPEFPLVALVFPHEAAFIEYCLSEGVQPQPGLRGYYLPTSNRVALYDSAAEGHSTTSGLDGTILHEAVHQVAFNTGIHSRIGTNPKWVVEGLATAFEVEAVRRNDRSRLPLARVNRSRYGWFQQSRARRVKTSLPNLIAQDSGFQSAVLDAYSESWALTFFLLETRGSEYARYLKLLAERDPLVEYTPQDRLADFERSFGLDAARLDVKLLRFYDDLAASARDDDDVAVNEE